MVSDALVGQLGLGVGVGSMRKVGWMGGRTEGYVDGQLRTRRAAAASSSRLSVLASSEDIPDSTGVCELTPVPFLLDNSGPFPGATTRCTS